MDSLAARLAQASPTAVDGVWQRHVPAKYTDTALAGRRGNGPLGHRRWQPGVVLGRPTESVIVEAYRHLIDPIAEPDGRVPPIRPRVLITCDVSVSEILDLRVAVHRTLADLSIEQLQSETHDRAAYAACQKVAAAAHQVGYQGIVAPAAARMGDTLVLFTELLPHGEHPVRTKQETWFELPADPRKPGRGGLPVRRCWRRSATH